MAGDNADVLAADNADVLAADNADVLAADTTDVLAADKYVASEEGGLACLSAWLALPCHALPCLALAWLLSQLGKVWLWEGLAVTTFTRCTWKLRDAGETPDIATHAINSNPCYK